MSPMPSLARTLILLSIASLAAHPSAQEQKPEAARPVHREQPDMAPAPRPEGPVLPPFVWPSDLPPSYQVNVDGAGQNIPNDAANEPSIAVDPTDPSHMVIGWRQFDSISSNFRQAGRAYTTDGGLTWNNNGPFTPGLFRSDPVLDADADGNIYYNSLQGNFSCDVFRSTDGGTTWSAPHAAYGGDKQWMAIDRTGGTGRGHDYEAWSSQASTTGMNVASRSIDDATTWQTPIPLPQDAIFGTLSVAPDGKLYVVGVDVNTFNSFWVARSSNAQDPGTAMTWDLSRNVSLGGAMAGWSGLNPDGLLGQAWIAADPASGNVYVLCSVDPPGADPLDVMIARSTDQGVTWSAPVRVNDDASTSNWQWFGTLAVAPNGRIDVVWNDTRNDASNQLSELFYASSTDGGATFSPNVAVAPPFDSTLGWPQQNKIGDYYDMVSDNAGASVAYAATFNGEQDVYYLRIGTSCATITIAPPTLPTATVGSGYTQALTASGGTAPYTFVVVAGALPSGLSLSSAGVLSGTPAAAGTFNFTVAAADAIGCSGSRPYTLVVNGGGCATITLSPPTLPDGTVAIAYNQALSASGGTAPYTFALASGTLPPGLSLTTAGVISGAPSAVGVYPFTVTATDATACAGSASYAVAITQIVDYVAGEGLGPSNGNRVKVFDQSGSERAAFVAYAAGAWGVNVASGNVDGGAWEVVLTGPGPGAVYGPHARAFDRTGVPVPGVSFYAYGTLRFGVNVAGAELDGDGADEILTGAGPGVVFGPHVRGFNFDGGPLVPISNLSFFAYGTLRYGVNVASGSVDPDGFDEIVTGAGPSPAFAPTVRGFDYDGAAVATIPGIAFNAYALSGHGVEVAGGDVDFDGYDELATAPGPGPSHPARLLGFQSDGGPIAALAGFDVTPFTTKYGGQVALADVSGDGPADLVGAPGRDPAASAQLAVYGYSGTSLTPLPVTISPFPGSAYGVNVAGGALGY